MTIRDPSLAAIYAELQRMEFKLETAKRMVRELDERKQNANAS
jgi:hypothetical protein